MIRHIQFQWKVTEPFLNRIIKIWSDRTKFALEKKYLEIKKKNSQTCFYFWYIKLATVQIWNQSNKFALICSSLKSLFLLKKLFRENSTEKNCLLRKQTQPTNTVNYVLWQLSQSALGKFTSVRLLVKVTRIFFNQL